MILSLVLCSRNDAYMGNSRWRLQTVLNYVAKQVCELERSDDVEVVVTDWGSAAPLQTALRLSPSAARITSFIEVPPIIAREAQKDSPFPEVLALNAAARRVRGQYIGRIDQDTLVGRRFLRLFFDLHESRKQLEVPLPLALLFANQRMVPYRFAAKCPSFQAVDQFIDHFGQRLSVQITPRRPFHGHGVGIWLLHRALWHECGGYDERMIYANKQEMNMIARLTQKYRLVDLGRLADHDFYHLEHYHPLMPRNSYTHRKVNSRSEFARQFFPPDRFHPNSDDWGLLRYPLRVVAYAGAVGPAAGVRRRFDTPWYLLLLGLVGIQVAFDRLVLSSPRAMAWRALWTHRARVARNTVRGQPVLRWPRLLMTRWRQRTRPS